MVSCAVSRVPYVKTPLLGASKFRVLNATVPYLNRCGVSVLVVVLFYLHRDEVDSNYRAQEEHCSNRSFVTYHLSQASEETGLALQSF